MAVEKVTYLRYSTYFHCPGITWRDVCSWTFLGPLKLFSVDCIKVNNVIQIRLTLGKTHSLKMQVFYSTASRVCRSESASEKVNITSGDGIYFYQDKSKLEGTHLRETRDVEQSAEKGYVRGRFFWEKCLNIRKYLVFLCGLLKSHLIYTECYKIDGF